MKKLILLLLIVPLEMISQYSQDVDVYDEYGNHLGTFEVDSDYSHNFSQLQGAIEDAAEMAVDKYINYLKQKERKEQEIRARQSWEQRGARVGITIPSYVTSTAAFESMIIQKEQAAYKRKIRAINQARTGGRKKSNLSKKEIKQSEAMQNEEDAIAREGEKMEAELRERREKILAEARERREKNKTKELKREEENYNILKYSEIFVGQVLYTTLAVFLSVENEKGWIKDSEIIVPKNAQVTIIGKAYDDRFVKVKFQDKVGFLLLESLHK